MLSYVLMMLHDLANDGGYISLRWRTEMGGDTAKGCQKPALQQKTTDDDAFL